MKHYRIAASCVLLFLSLVLLSACKGTAKHDRQTATDIPLQYATLLRLSEGEGYTMAEFRNPWDSTSVLHRYVLVPKDQELPSDLPEGDIIRTPLSRMLVYVSVHASLFNELGCLDAIQAVGDAQYMYIDTLQHDIRNGRVVDLGSSNAINIEQIIDFSPDAVVISAMEDNNSYAKVLTVGIPVVECADYMEVGPLARAEWMRFYGRLVGKGREADSLFASIERQYNALHAKVQHLTDNPVVLDGKKLDSSWYVAGNASTVGRIITDAGGRYVFSDETSSGSVPYSPEVVLDRGLDADIWMMKYYKEDADLTLRDIASDWQGYTRLKAYRNRRVYGVNLSRTDFYMSTPFHPEVLLREYVHIFHPELFDTNFQPEHPDSTAESEHSDSNFQPTYFKRIAE